MKLYKPRLAHCATAGLGGGFRVSRGGPTTSRRGDGTSGGGWVNAHRAVMLVAESLGEPLGRHYDVAIAIGD